MNGNIRAEYGKEILINLSKKLTVNMELVLIEVISKICDYFYTKYKK